MHISCGLPFRRTMLDIKLFLCVVNLLNAMLLEVLCSCRTRIRPVIAVVTCLKLVGALLHLFIGLLPLLSLVVYIAMRFDPWLNLIWVRRPRFLARRQVVSRVRLTSAMMARRSKFPLMMMVPSVATLTLTSWFFREI